MKDIFKKILNFFNIHPDNNQKILLTSVFISGFLFTYISPTITKTIVSDLPAQWLAIESLIAALSGLLVGMVWKNKVREKALKWFTILAITESILGFLLGMFLTFVAYNSWLFAIASLIYSSLITTFIGKCLMSFRSKLWNEKGREVYDNNNSVVGSIVCIIGYLTALLFLPSIKIATFLWGVGCIVDDIGWIIVYNKNKENLKDEG